MTGGAGASYYWWQRPQPQLPAGIALGNGRIEADEIDIDTKFAGRIAELRVDEGDMVTAGQVVARMDTRDLEASLKKGEAQVEQAQQAIEEARRQRRAAAKPGACWPSRRSTARAICSKKGFATKERYDQRQQELDGAKAALSGREARAIASPSRRSTPRSTTSNSTGSISPTTRWSRRATAASSIASPMSARCCRPAARSSPCSTSRYVYMDIYLPTRDAGKVKVGADARIVLDAYPDRADPGEGVVHRHAGAVHAEDRSRPRPSATS